MHHVDEKPDWTIKIPWSEKQDETSVECGTMIGAR
jgi:hypothetical protein